MSSPANYTITSVEDTTFEPDAYGNKFYSVKFEGWDGKVLWKTPARPENNTQVYGSISPSKSGKAMIFKKEKKEDWREGERATGYAGPAPVQNTTAGVWNGEKPQLTNRNDDIRWGLCTKEANLYVTKNLPDLGATEWSVTVNEYANALYSVADKPKLDKDTEAVKEFFGGEEIPL